MEITTSWKEEGIAKGLEMARQERTARILLRLLDRRCGPLPSELIARVGALPVDSLDRLADWLLDFASLADLERWLAHEPLDRQVIEIETGGMEDGLRMGFEKGYRQGLREGREEGSARTLVRLLTRRYGRVPRSLRLWIGVLTVRDRDRLTDELFRFSTLDDLECWLSSLTYSASSGRRVNQLERCRPELFSK